MFVVAAQQLAVGGEEVRAVQQIGPPIGIETQGGASKQDRRLGSIGQRNELQLIDRLTLKDERVLPLPATPPNRWYGRAVPSAGQSVRESPLDRRYPT